MIKIFKKFKGVIWNMPELTTVAKKSLVSPEHCLPSRWRVWKTEPAARVLDVKDSWPVRCSWVWLGSGTLPLTPPATQGAGGAATATHLRPNGRVGSSHGSPSNDCEHLIPWVKPFSA